MKEQDSLRRFLLEDLGIRGEWVNLSASWQAAKAHQHGSTRIQQQLGHALAAVTMLSATVKFSGSMILQTQGDGAIRTLVAQATDNRKIRGVVRCNEDADDSAALLGDGRLVLTIENGSARPYQGIVPLHGGNLASALESYFQQSEQLNTRLWLVANDTDAVGLLLQELPSQESQEASWEHITLLANTLTEQELLSLNCEDLLYRLFHEEKVRIFAPEAVEFACSCSRERIERTLRAMDKTELTDILQERGNIEVICEFCGKHNYFDAIDVESLFSQHSVNHDSSTRH